MNIAQNKLVYISRSFWNPYTENGGTDICITFVGVGKSFTGHVSYSMKGMANVKNEYRLFRGDTLHCILKYSF